MPCKSPDNDLAGLKGRRAVIDGEFATIRYVGLVPPTKGTWLGVEWDRLERGKHSGTKDGVQYFECRNPGAGSFVRISPRVNLGMAFWEAFKEKYVRVDKSASLEGFPTTIGDTEAKVEAVGFDKYIDQRSRQVLMKRKETWLQG
ncbi:hypothetical protein EV182_003213, partial [Spiromyces aspiralis]